MIIYVFFQSEKDDWSSSFNQTSPENRFQGGSAAVLQSDMLIVHNFGGNPRKEPHSSTTIIPIVRAKKGAVHNRSYVTKKIFLPPKTKRGELPHCFRSAVIRHPAKRKDVFFFCSILPRYLFKKKSNSIDYHPIGIEMSFPSFLLIIIPIRIFLISEMKSLVFPRSQFHCARAH